MVLPEVVGFELVGSLPERATGTDLVLTITQMLRAKGVVGKFVEFYGKGMNSLPVADRATIANMSPEYGATMGYFPVDHETLKYLKQTGRSAARLQQIAAYLQANEMFSSPQTTTSIQFSDSLSLDLASVQPSLAGPKRPHDRVLLRDMKTDFQNSLSAPIGFKGYQMSEKEIQSTSTFTFKGQSYTIGNGSVVIAAITSCTNTSNPGVMLAAGLVAKKAVELGLTVKPYIKTSLSPGSKAVTEYYRISGLDKYLEKLGFYNTGYGCMTCIGNSGNLDSEVADAVQDLVVAGVLSGNRNFEGRVHPLTRANYLASPPLVIAYALAGRLDIDFDHEPVSCTQEGKLVYLHDLWPSKAEINELETKLIKGELFATIYKTITEGNEAWKKLPVITANQYEWDANSTYIKNPPYFDDISLTPPPVPDIRNARCLLHLGDSVTTDHISPAGNIAKESPASRYLLERGVAREDFNTYGARRGNDKVMSRGTFANIRLVNKMYHKVGPQTTHIPSGETQPVADVAKRYRREGTDMIVLAGSEYGSGSSRDWAAKGPYLIGIRAIIAESFERIHRSNLVGVGILPLEFVDGQNADSLKLTGSEQFNIPINASSLTPGCMIRVETDSGVSFDTKCRVDTDVEVLYYQHGGILQYVLRKIAGRAKV